MIFLVNVFFTFGFSNPYTGFFLFNLLFVTKVKQPFFSCIPFSPTLPLYGFLECVDALVINLAASAFSKTHYIAQEFSVMQNYWWDA